MAKVRLVYEVEVNTGEIDSGVFASYLNALVPMENDGTIPISFWEILDGMKLIEVEAVEK